VKVLIKNLPIFFLFPSKEFLPISFKIQLLETSPQKQKEQRQKQLCADKLVTTQIWMLKNLMSLFSDVFSLPFNWVQPQHNWVQQLGAATTGRGYNWVRQQLVAASPNWSRRNNWARQHLGVATSGRGYNWVRRLQVDAATIGCGKNWARQQLGAATSGRGYN
jgi:hypothetical protein